MRKNDQTKMIMVVDKKGSTICVYSNGTIRWGRVGLVWTVALTLDSRSDKGLDVGFR
jgi:hypothetical protein